MTTTGHTLKVVLDRDTVCLSVVCHEPDTANCRQGCQKCEEACCDPDSHIKPLGYCSPTEWIAAGDTMAEDYAGNDELPLHDGMPINLSWNGDFYEWTALTQPAAVTPSLEIGTDEWAMAQTLQAKRG